MQNTLKYHVYSNLIRTPLLKIMILVSILKRNGIFSIFKKNKICIYYEPQFSYIVDELKKSGYYLLYIDRRIFEYSFFKHLKNFILDQENNRELFCLDTYDKYDSEISKYKKDLDKVCKALKNVTRSKLFILPKLNDPWIIQVVDRLTNNDWKTIVYDREGIVTPKRMEYVPETISKFKIDCNLIVTENEIHKSFFQKVKDYGNLNCEIIVNGNPRSDYWFKQKNINNISYTLKRPRKYLYFAFGHKNYINFYYNRDPDSKNYNWTSLLKDIHDSLVDHFSNSDDELIYKTYHKSKRDYYEGVEALRSLSNVNFFDDEIQAADLIKESDVIIGFQTAALIETMFTNKPIIYCGWGEVYEKIKDTMIEYHELGKQNGVLHAKDKLSFQSLLKKKHGIYDHNEEARSKFRYKYMFNKNGEVAKNFVNIINQYSNL